VRLAALQIVESQWGSMLKRLVMGATSALALSVVAAPAVAYRCPTDMAMIDAALAKNAPLSKADLARVRQLRAEGEALNRHGTTREAHSAAVAKFAQAQVHSW
jgi:hypothetical protein